MKRNQGITLVALIITIVVMLILVAVSVNVLIKSDLIGIAERTGEKYKAAAEDESKGGAVVINGKTYNSIEDYTSKTHNWAMNGNALVCTHCNSTLQIGQEVKYQDTGATSTTITAEKTGYTSDQTIEKGTDVKWVVLGFKDANNDGRNESIVITTAEPTKTSINWKSELQIYNNGMEELNRMCKELYGNNARSITMDDINSALGYQPQGAAYINVNENNENVFTTTGNFTTKAKELEIWNDLKSYAVGSDTAEKYAESVYNGYFYSVDTSGNITNKFETPDTNLEQGELQELLSNTGNNAKIMQTAVVQKSYVGKAPMLARDIVFGTGNTYNYSVATQSISAGRYIISGTNVNKVFEVGMFNIASGNVGSGTTMGAVLTRLDNSLSESTIRDVSKLTPSITPVSFIQTAISSGNKINQSKYEYPLRAVITLTGEIPEVGEVITQYGEGSSSSGSESGDLGLM